MEVEVWSVVVLVVSRVISVVVEVLGVEEDSVEVVEVLVGVGVFGEGVVDWFLY